MNFLDSQAAFALRVKNLHDRLSNQIDDALHEKGFSIQGKATGIVQLIYTKGPCSASYIAEQLGFSHQLTTQRLASLYRAGIAISQPDPDDRRRNQVLLTKLGDNEAEKLQLFLPQLNVAYSDLFEELEADLNTLICSASESLARKPLIERFSKI